MMSSLRMMTRTVVIALVITQVASAPAYAASAAEISSSARAALDNLYSSTPAARTLGERARGVLVFPTILKGGFIFGGQVGEGVLFRRGRASAYYVTTGASYGFQAGLQAYGYALFLMTDKAIEYLNSSDGFELGAGPSLVIVDQGMAAGMSTTTARGDIFAFIFNQEGLMGGMALQGSKITQIYPQ